MKLTRLLIVGLICGLLPAQAPQSCYTCLAQMCGALQSQIQNLEYSIAAAEALVAISTASCKYAPWPLVNSSSCALAAGLATNIALMKYQLSQLNAQYSRLGCWGGMPL